VDDEMTPRASVRLIAFALVLPLLASDASAQNDAARIYWINRDSLRVHCAHRDGSEPGTLIWGLIGLWGLAVDEPGGKVYWSQTHEIGVEEKIHRANLDGSDQEAIVASGLQQTTGLAIDSASGHLYWADRFQQKIERTDLDGQNRVTLLSGLGLPWGLALDLSAGKMYWTEGAKIRRADLDGSNVEDLITSGITNAQGIALDLSAGKMYWAAYSFGRIERADLDGSNQEVLLSGLGGVGDLAIDEAAGKIYWVDDIYDKVRRANLDGSSIEDLVTGVSTPVALALGPALVPQVTIPIDPRDTYLRIYPADDATDATPIALAPLGIAPGETVGLKRVGDWDGGPGGDTATSLNGVYSASDVLLAWNVQDRVADAVIPGEGHSVYTGPTLRGGAIPPTSPRISRLMIPSLRCRLVRRTSSRPRPTTPTWITSRRAEGIPTETSLS
jgi:low density lipoprotein receptor-related protein 5/6